MFSLADLAFEVHPALPPGASSAGVVTAVAPEHERHHRSALERAWGNDRLFGRRANRLGIRLRVAKAMWDWPGRSVADEILTGTPADALQWLAYWAHKTCTRILQQSMERAWHDAFDHRPSAYWSPTAPVTPTNTELDPLSFEMDPGPPPF